MNQPTDEEKIRTGELNRRDFLKRVGYASALTLAAGGLGLALYDSKGPAPSEGQKALTGLGDYRPTDLAAGPGKMAIVRGTDRAVMVERGVKALGGMESFIQQGRPGAHQGQRRLRHPGLPGGHHPPGGAGRRGRPLFQGRGGPGAGDGQPHQQSRQLLRDHRAGRGGPDQRGPDHRAPGRPVCSRSACPAASSSRIGRSWPGSSRE